MKRSPQPRLSIVEEQPSSTGDFEFYRARRLQKYGAPPPMPRVRAVPLERERLTERSFQAVVEHALDKPHALAPRSWALYAVVGIPALLFLSALLQSC